MQSHRISDPSYKAALLRTGRTLDCPLGSPRPEHGTRIYLPLQKQLYSSYISPPRSSPSPPPEPTYSEDELVTLGGTDDEDEEVVLTPEIQSILGVLTSMPQDGWRLAENKLPGYKVINEDKRSNQLAYYYHKK